jgi:tRNA nucleotidyltransferase/poly(A) polymerase
MLEEYYKILRAGSAEKTFRGLADVGLLEPIAKELHRGASDTLWRSLAALDAYRRQFPSTPETLTNAILLGSLIVPLGISLHPPRENRVPVRPAAPVGRVGHVGEETEAGTEHERARRRPPGLKLGELPLARRDVERLGQVVQMQRRMRDLGASPKAQHALAHRHIFREALTWLEIHGGPPDLVEHWKAIAAEVPAPAPAHDAQSGDAPPPGGRRRRRRRRRGRGHGPTPH